jgi:integrase
MSGTKGLGFLRQLPDGRWQAVVELSPQNGKRRKITKTRNGKTEAERELRLLQNLKEKNKLPTISSRKKITFKSLRELWEDSLDNKVAAIHMKPKTAFDYKEISKYIGKHFDFDDIRKIDTESIEFYLSNLVIKGNLSQSTVTKYRTIMNNMFTLAVTKGTVIDNPVTACKSFKSKRGTIGNITVISSDEHKAILKYTKGVFDQYKESKQKTGWLTYVIYMLAYCTGIREGEMAGLRWSQFFPEENRIFINNNISYVPGDGLKEGLPKTQQSIRNILIPHSMTILLLELKEIYKKRESPKSKYVFHTVTGNCIQPRNILRAFQVACGSAKIERKITFHSIRHTHATKLIGNNINIKTVSLRLGHASVQITLDTYAHYISFAEQKSADLFESDFITPSITP